MQNKIKSIVAVAMMAVMLLCGSIPAMAAETSSVTNDTAVMTENVSSEDSTRASSLVAEFHYTGRLAKNKVLGTVTVGKSCKTLNWTVGRTGSTGNVRFLLRKKSTGDSRNVTTTANNKLGSITYVTAMTPGVWEVSVAWNSNNWLYDVDLYFYEK